MQQATDITAQESVIVIGGREINVRFDHNQMRMSEMYWQRTTLQRTGYLGIVEQAIARTYCGLGAICYGAVASPAMAMGKEPISMREFDRMFDYDALRPAAQQLIDGVLESLPRKKGSAKKAESRA